MREREKEREGGSEGGSEVEREREREREREKAREERKEREARGAPHISEAWLCNCKACTEALRLVKGSCGRRLPRTHRLVGAGLSLGFSKKWTASCIYSVPVLWCPD